MTVQRKALCEHAKLLFLQGLAATLIANQLSLPVSTIRKWVEKGNWKAIRESRPPTPGLLTIRGEDLDRAYGLASESRKLRSTLARVLSLHADALALIDVKPNLSLLKEVGDVIETFARSARIVHDWGSEGASGLILVSELSATASHPGPALPAAIDVPQVACGPDTATNCGQPSTHNSQTPQSAQVDTAQTDIAQVKDIQPTLCEDSSASAQSGGPVT